MTTTNQNTTTTNNGNAGTAKTKVPLTAVEAAAKIEKILEQLTPSERKRVLAFVNADSE